MIEIFEIHQDKEKTAKSLGALATDLDRVFIMQEDGQSIGAGVLGIEKGVVLIKDIKTDKPFAYFDLLSRSLLNVVRDFNPIKVRLVNYDKYFLDFGFDENGEAFSDKITLEGWCTKNCDGCKACK